MDLDVNMKAVMLGGVFLIVSKESRAEFLLPFNWYPVFPWVFVMFVVVVFFLRHVKIVKLSGFKMFTTIQC